MGLKYRPYLSQRCDIVMECANNGGQLCVAGGIDCHRHRVCLQAQSSVPRVDRPPYYVDAGMLNIHISPCDVPLAVTATHSFIPGRVNIWSNRCHYCQERQDELLHAQERHCGGCQAGMVSRVVCHEQGKRLPFNQNLACGEVSSKTIISKYPFKIMC